MHPLIHRAIAAARKQADVDEIELRNPDYISVFRVIWAAIYGFFSERPGQILMSAFVLLMVWGYHGQLDLLNRLWPDFRGLGIDVGNRPPLIPGIPWDNELICFVGGALLLVAIPAALIKLVFKERLVDYGLGLPPPERRVLALWTFVVLVAVSIVPFISATQDPSMRAIYPFFRPFPSLASFAAYQGAYLLFFLAIEFIFRGYLLFGLEGIVDRDAPDPAGGVPGRFFFGKYALLIQMLSYTAWHLGKPLPELWGTLVWGLAAGAAAYACRSIWPVLLAHWLLNIFLDAKILGYI
jgi:hypothetical protein